MTDQYAVIGNPIGHTKSPLIHGLFAEETRQDMTYTAVEGPLEPEDAFAAVVRSFAASGGKGMNVTAPFKLQAYAMADERSERAALAGAVNALMFRCYGSGYLSLGGGCLSRVRPGRFPELQREHRAMRRT